jgi:nucleotide-binding universal stress UspA family protein
VNLWPAELERNVNRIEPLLSRNLQTVTPVTTVTCGTPGARPSTPGSVPVSAARRLVSVWSKVPLCRILQVHVEVAMDEFRPELLVALGDEAGTGAVDWAVSRASESGLALRLVHVVHPPRGLAGPDNLLLTFDAVELVGRQIVRSAAERVVNLTGRELTVTTATPTGHPVGALIRQVTTSCVAVVMQHRPGLRDGRLFGGSVVAGVAGRVHVPVISVPDTWSPRPPGPTEMPGPAPHVTIGVATLDHADELIEHALATAPLGAGSCLTLLHAWHIPVPYELGLRTPDFATGWIERETRVLQELATPWQGKFPHIDVETRLEHGHPASVLADASRNSDHLVLGRSHAHPVRHVGSVAATLLRQSACPVELVPLPTRPRYGD